MTDIAVGIDHQGGANNDTVAANSSMTPTTTITPQQQQREMWICDVCKKAKFEDFEEACRHEEACGALQSALTDDVVANDDDPKNGNSSNDIHHGGVLQDSKSKSGNITTTITNTTTTNTFVSSSQGSSATISSSENTVDLVKVVASPTSTTKSIINNKKRPSPTNDNNNTTDSNLNSSVQLIQVVHPADRRSTEKTNKPPPKKAKTTTTTTKGKRAASKNNINNKKKDNNKNSKMDSNAAAASWAAIFQQKGNNNSKKDKSKTTTMIDTKTLMAEQATVEFQAKRRLEREKEKQRQKRRQENFFQKRKTNTITTNTSKPTNATTSSSKFAYCSCPRFPVPSFVHGGNNNNNNNNYDDDNSPQPRLSLESNNDNNNKELIVSKDDLDKARLLVQKSLPFPGRQLLEFTTKEGDEFSSWDFPQTFLDDNKNDDAKISGGVTTTTTTTDEHHPHPILDDNASSIQHELAKILTITESSPSCRTNRNINDNHHHHHHHQSLCWVDRYLLGSSSSSIDDSNDDDDHNQQQRSTTNTIICGKTNQVVAEQLDAFVREWMVEREKSHKRMAEKQKALLKKQQQRGNNNKTKRKKKKKTTTTTSTRDDDEDLWMDTEDEEDMTLLPSICLLEGPVGSCKSSLVHYVASKCDCPVVELNTSTNRGGTQLRKLLEDSGSNHSSLEMLKKEKKKQEANKKRNIFFRNKNNNLVDSSDDDDDDDEKENEQKAGSSLTVILIDEVDNLYDSAGDNGFWTALTDLTKSARCPVFLTANSFPKGLSSSPSLRYRHYITSRPTPTECAHKMEHILNLEGVKILEENEGSGNTNKGGEALASIAEQCGCDLRRILHELQLFSCIKQSILHAQKTSLGSCNENNYGHVLGQQDVTIENVSPEIVAFDKSSLITIKGKNFKYLHQGSLKVLVGVQECHASRVVDDETILAIVPPCHLVYGVDKCGMPAASSGMIGIQRPSLEAEFAPISLRSGPSKVSPPSNFFSSTRTISLPLEGDGSIAVVSPCNVRYSFPASDDPPSDDEDISEVEFDDVKSDWLGCQASCLRKRLNALMPLRETQKEETIKAAEELINAELKKIKEENNLLPLSPRSCSEESVARRLEKDAEDQLVVLERMARDLELSSDASLLNSYGGIPLPSGASPGFGYHFTPEGPSSGGTLSRHGNATQCSEDRLFSTGWKDTCAFYGDQDAWMRQPTGRDAYLLNLAHKRGRGQAQSTEQEASLQDDKKEEDGCKNNDRDCDFTHWVPHDSRISSEDFCLQSPIPYCLSRLPALLINAGTATSRLYVPQDVVLRRLSQRLESLLEMMGVLYSAEAQAKMRCSGLDRSIADPTLWQEFDTRIFLDYIPLLRCIATYEQAAQSFADDTEGLGSRRRTRKSAKQGRTHYFESLNPSYCWNDEPLYSATAVGRQLADSRLVYQPSPHLST